MAELDRRPEIPSPRFSWDTVRRAVRYAPVVAAMAGGAAVALLLAWNVRNFEDSRRLRELESIANTRSDHLQTMLDSSLEVIRGLAALYFASQQVDRSEFERFATDLLSRHGHVDSVAFAPLVREENREALRTGTFPMAPDVRLEIRPPASEGVMEAGDGVAYPVVFAVPSESALAQEIGVDVGLHGPTTEALRSARDSGNARATASFRGGGTAAGAGPESAGGWEVRAVIPVYANGKLRETVSEGQANLDGFVLCTVHPARLLGIALEAGTSVDMGVSLESRSRAGRMRITFVEDDAGGWRAIDEGEDGDESAMSDEGRAAVVAASTSSVHSPIVFAGEAWRVAFQPSEDYIRARSRWPEWAVLLGGLGLTVLFGGYVGLLIGRSARIEKLVAERTRDLEREVAERKRTAATLRDSEALYQSLVGTIPLHLFRKDLKGRFTFANEKFCRALSHSLDEIIGRTDADFFPPAIAEKYRWDDGKVIERGHVLREVEEHPTREGMRVVEVIKAPVRDAGGRIVGVQGLFWDVTDRMRAQEELRNAAEELARSNSDLEQFAYIASHDLQEPLRMIASYLQLLEKRYGPNLDGDAREFIGFAVDGARRMRALIADLLSYSRVGTHGQSLAPVDVGAALDTALANLAIAIEESGAEIRRPDAPLPWVVGDPIQLVQLFQNLVGNALKFRSPERSPVVRIEAQPDPDAPAMWRFVVRDNGIGIDPKFTERIFAIFQRLHAREEYEGTGIGLAVCKKIVERHGGRIQVESKPGEGAAFAFTLRRAAPRGVAGDGI